MSYPEDEQQQGPAARAADLAAQQVGSIVEAARAGAEQVTAAAEHEASEIRADAQREAVRMGEDARRDARERIAAAQAAADEVLAEAKAVSAGLRQLGQLLTVHAERILRDVETSHRAISADLRAAGAHAGRTGRAGAAPPAGDEPGAPGQRPRGGGGASPFADLEPPSWVEQAGLSGRRGARGQ